MYQDALITTPLSRTVSLKRNITGLFFKPADYAALAATNNQIHAGSKGLLLLSCYSDSSSKNNIPNIPIEWMYKNKLPNINVDFIHKEYLRFDEPYFIVVLYKIVNIPTTKECKLPSKKHYTFLTGSTANNFDNFFEVI